MPQSRDEAARNMRVLGILLMCLASWDLLQAFLFPVDLGSLGVDQGLDTQPLLMGSAIASAVANAIEFYFGLIAFRGCPNGFAATVCLVMGVLELAIISIALASGSVALAKGLGYIGSGLLALCYWYYYKALRT